MKGFKVWLVLFFLGIFSGMFAELVSVDVVLLEVADEDVTSYARKCVIDILPDEVKVQGIVIFDKNPVEDVYKDAFLVLDCKDAVKMTPTSYSNVNVFLGKPTQILRDGKLPDCFLSVIPLDTNNDDDFDRLKFVIRKTINEKTLTFATLIVEW